MTVAGAQSGSAHRSDEALRLLSDPEQYSVALERQRASIESLAEIDPERSRLLELDEAAARELGLCRDVPALADLLDLQGVMPESCLSLGCLTGGTERRLLAEGIGRHWEGIEISPRVVETARRRAVEANLEIDYRTGDLETVALEPERYDLIVADRCLSRVCELEHVVAETWRALKPTGLLWVVDYVGDNRYRYSRARLQLANRALRRLPEELKWDDLNGGRVDPILRPPLETLAPFDAIRAADVRRLLQQRLSVVRIHVSGSILPLVCPVGTRAAFARSPESRALFEELFQLDRLLVATGALRGTICHALLTKRVSDVLPLEAFAAQIESNDGGRRRRVYGRVEERAELGDDQIDALFRADLNAAVNAARSLVPGFDRLPEEKQAVVVEIVFDLGAKDASALDDVFGALALRDWAEAGQALERSQWAVRRGARGRLACEALARPDPAPRPVRRLPARLGPVTPADRYRAAKDLWIVTTFFNPAGYETKLRNCTAFLAPILAGGLPWRLAECAHPGRAHALAPDESVLQMRAESTLWQKERLLNVLVEQLPDSCTKVAWLDADVLFDDPNWAVETSALLDEYELVQPWENAVRLPQGATSSEGSIQYRHRADQVVVAEGRHWRGFGARSGDAADEAVPVRQRGHPGFAWAARRDLLQRHTLYDRCVVGGGDLLIAYASVGDWSSSCILNGLGGAGPLHTHASSWAEGWYGAVRGRIGHLPGVSLLHLWHGAYAHRGHHLRGFQLNALGFDPETDLVLNSDKCWEWAPGKPALSRWAERYFASRLEDG